VNSKKIEKVNTATLVLDGLEFVKNRVTDIQDSRNYAAHNRVKNHLLFFLGADPLGAFRHRSTLDLPPILSLPGTEIKYCTLIKKKSKFSSYIGNFRWDRVQSHKRKGFLVYEEMHKYFHHI
jgi:hypothetical protein